MTTRQQQREKTAKYRANWDLAGVNREWQREKTARRKATKGADKELATVIQALTARLPGKWSASASRGELEVTTAVGQVSIRVRRRAASDVWRCTAWVKGPAGGLQVAAHRADDAAAALDGGLAQLSDLARKLANVGGEPC